MHDDPPETMHSMENHRRGALHAVTAFVVTIAIIGVLAAVALLALTSLAPHLANLRETQPASVFYLGGMLIGFLAVAVLAATAYFLIKSHLPRPIVRRTLISAAAIIVTFIALMATVKFLQETAPQAAKKATERLVPPVRVMLVETRSQPVVIETQGVIESKREVTVAAEVSGVVTHVSPNLLRGSLVKEGELLVRIEDADYRAARALARTQLAEAELNLELEKAKREQALRDWEKLGRGTPPKLALREPQLAAAQARLNSTRAELDRANRNVERTEIRAPFDAMVRLKSVEVGGFLAPGGRIAEFYSPAELEVRLPLSLEDFGFLKRLDDGTIGGTVTLRGTVGVTEHTWTGRIDRVDGEVDRKTLSATCIVAVAPNHELPAHLRLPPVGLFVRATIPGSELDGVTEIPRVALRGGDTVIVVSPENIATERTVTVLRRSRDKAWISEGLQSGDQVLLKGLRGVTDEGVRVSISNPADETEKPEPGNH